jgi:hypothetical protein
MDEGVGILKERAAGVTAFGAMLPYQRASRSTEFAPQPDLAARLTYGEVGGPSCR